MGNFTRSSKRTVGLATFFIAFAVLALIPPTLVAADSWKIPGNNGVSFEFNYGLPWEKSGFVVHTVSAKPDISNLKVPGFVRLGNLRAFALDTNGRTTSNGVSKFKKSFEFTVVLPPDIVRKLKESRVTDPFLYFWDPQAGTWVNPASTKQSGAYSFGRFKRKKLGNGMISLSVQIKSWPADDPACGTGG